MALATILIGTPATAQSGAGSATALVDSAAAGRLAWSRANAALRNGDLAAAHKEAERAAHAWGVQPAYVWGHARISALTGDTAALRAALTKYAGFGLGRDLRADTAFARYSVLPWFAEVARVHDANRAPLVRSRARVTLADSTFWPEGVTYDTKTRRFYVASIKHGTIAEIREDGTAEEILVRDQPGFGAVLGVHADPRQLVLWATVSDVEAARHTRNNPAQAALLRINQATGAIERRWTLPPSERGHTLGDLAVGPAGDVFVTDSNEPFLYRLRPGSDTLERVTHPLFRSLQGVAPTPDGTLLYIADYSHGLLRLDLASGAVSHLEAAPGVTSVGTDGIVWHRGGIIAVQNGVAPARVVKYVLDREGKRITRAEVLDRNYQIADEPTIGTLVGDTYVYVATGSFEKYNTDGSRNRVPLRLPVLLEVPLCEMRNARCEMRN